MEREEVYSVCGVEGQVRNLSEWLGVGVTCEPGYLHEENWTRQDCWKRAPGQGEQCELEEFLLEEQEVVDMAQVDNV